MLDGLGRHGIAPVKDNLPQPLMSAQQKGIQYFMGENCEWKIHFEGSLKFIEDMVGTTVCVFANNGFGDYLFLKRCDGSNTFDLEVFEFFHEGPEIVDVDEDLETLLGLVDRPPSADHYPKAVYKTGETVLLGDRVQVKVWVEFWKGWQNGVVEYVPGISRKKLDYEYGGLKEVAIRFPNGQIRYIVDPDNGILRRVRFINRKSSN